MLCGHGIWAWYGHGMVGKGRVGSYVGIYVYTNVFVSIICMKFSRAIQKRALNGMKSKASLGNEVPGFSTASDNDGTPCAQHDANASSAETQFPCTLGTLTAHHLAQ